MKIECNIKIKEIYVKNTTTGLFALEIYYSRYMIISDRVYIEIEMHNVKGN